MDLGCWSNTDFAVAISCSVPYPPPLGLSCANAVWPKGKTLIFIAWSPSSKCLYQTRKNIDNTKDL